MPSRTARTAWNGSPETGAGQVELMSGGLDMCDGNFPKRAAEKVDDTTSLAGFQKAAGAVKASRPASKALTGTTFTLGAGLE